VRKWNVVLSTLILALLAAHGIVGTVLLMGGNILLKPLARALFTLVMVHAVISILLSIQGIRTWLRTGALYFKENKSFWIRRISGLAIMILICLHAAMFGHKPNGSNTLAGLDMFVQLLMVVSVLVHVVTNVKPLFIAFGCRAGKKKTVTIIAVFSVFIAFCAAGLITYYVR
jgi:succinate dehydrogenase hydrophobic anchor subunit